MKKNNKGFMLVETIIVTVVVATIMTSLYIVFNRVYTAYDKKGKYTDVDAVYALKMMEDYMIDETTFNEKLKNTNTNSFVEITCTTETYCESVFDEYNVNKMYIVKNEENALNHLIEEKINETFKEYLEYLINIGVFEETYSHLLVVETYAIDDENEKDIFNKYAYLPIK